MLKSTLRVRFTRLVGAPLLAAAAVGLFAVAGACGGSEGADPTPTFTREVEDKSLDLKPAPDFTINAYQGSEVIGGDTLQLSDLQGKPLALNFWGGLCPPCRAELPDFQAFYDSHKDEINLFGLDVGAVFGLGRQGRRQGPAGRTGHHLSGGVHRGRERDKESTVSWAYPQLRSSPRTATYIRLWQGPLNEEKLAEITEEMLAATGS